MAGKELIQVNLKGDKILLQALAKYGPEAIKVATASLYASGENIMAISKEEYVPVETGNLRASGYVGISRETAKSVTVVLGYGGPAAPYALAVHENPRAGRTGGVSPGGKKYKRWAQVGQWKYLETPVKENLGNVISKLKRDLDQAFRRV